MKEFVLIEKKSRFIAYSENISSVKQFEEMLFQIQAQHKKATHICWAYALKENGVEVIRFNDDGEPAGTAGKPILSVIEKKKLCDVAVIVVRYFGGVKLGSGGLVRAYSKATSGVLQWEL